MESIKLYLGNELLAYPYPTVWKKISKLFSQLLLVTLRIKSGF